MLQHRNTPECRSLHKLLYNTYLFAVVALTIAPPLRPPTVAVALVAATADECKSSLCKSHIQKSAHRNLLITLIMTATAYCTRFVIRVTHIAVQQKGCKIVVQTRKNTTTVMRPPLSISPTLWRSATCACYLLPRKPQTNPRTRARVRQILINIQHVNHLRGA